MQQDPNPAVSGAEQFDGNAPPWPLEPCALRSSRHARASNIAQRAEDRHADARRACTVWQLTQRNSAAAVLRTEARKRR
jgi:hypothetical protein